MRVNHVIWDWNGTLLDDAQLAVAAVNELLALQGRGPTDVAEYRRMVEVPVRRYYEKIFDLGAMPFEELSDRFMAGYLGRIGEARLASGAREALALLRRAGCAQAIVSSFQKDILLQCLERFSLAPYFERVSAAGDSYGESKIGRAAQYLAGCGADPRRTVVIGDMLHDRDMAKALGARCILVSSGHQGREQLQAAGVPVAGDVLGAARLALESE